jgi:hypothetical protein
MGLGWFALSAWLVNGWIRVARSLGLQGECRRNVHPEAEERERERERERASPKIAVFLSHSSRYLVRALVVLHATYYVSTRY